MWAEGMRILMYLILFSLGWHLGMAQEWWHKWIVAGMFSYAAGAFIRMMWA